MLYRIINMSDPYTIECNSLDVAFVACVLLGDGQYIFDCEDEEQGVPPFMFGGIEDWCAEKFNASDEEVAQRVLNEKREELATALESCLIGGTEDREVFNIALGLLEEHEIGEFKRQWHKKRLTSLNNIGARAYALAHKLRTGEGNAPRAPQQVFPI